MEYTVERNTLAFSEVLRITQSEFEKLASGKDYLLSQLLIEQRFDHLIGNFLDFHRSVYSATIDHSLDMFMVTAKLDELTSDITRMFLNFLSSARAYLDQLAKSVRPELRLELESKKRSEYDAHLSYRTLEQMRNSAQHARLPIHLFRLSSGWRDIEDPVNRKMVSKVVALFEPKTLSEDKKFKKEILQELLALETQEIQIMPWTKEYLSCLSAIHEYCRAQNLHICEESTAFNKSYIDRYCELDGDSFSLSVHAYASSAEGLREKEVYLGPRIDDALGILRRRHRSLVNLSQRIIEI